MNDTILIVALLASNVFWMAFHFFNHAQHMRAYQWMIGFRPQPSESPASIGGGFIATRTNRSVSSSILGQEIPATPPLPNTVGTITE